MSVILQAPYPALRTTSILPSPDFSNTEAKKVRLKSIFRSMNGTKRTYTQTSPDTQLTFRFNLVRPKALELREFIRVYFDKRTKLTTHDNEVWLVRFIDDPFEFTGERRAVPSRELYTITLTMRGTQVS